MRNQSFVCMDRLNMTNQSPKEDLKTYRLRLHYFHEDELFSNRVNLFLVAESMLFISYVTSLNILALNKCISIVIGILGITVTVLCGFVNIRASTALNKLKDRLEETDNVYESLRKEHGQVSVNVVLGWLLTIAFFVVWISLLILNFCCYN